MWGLRRKQSFPHLACLCPSGVCSRCGGRILRLGLLSVMRVDRMATPKKDCSDPQTHSLRDSLSSVGVSCLPWASQRELKGMWSSHSARSHQVVRPNLGWIQEICLIPLTKGQVLLVLRGSKTSCFRVPPPFRELKFKCLAGFDTTRKHLSFQGLDWISRDSMHSLQNS